jgi:hypothetical protein
MERGVISQPRVEEIKDLCMCNSVLSPEKITFVYQVVYFKPNITCVGMNYEIQDYVVTKSHKEI